MKAIVYTRVSTEDQAKNGASLENQMERIRQYCAYRSFEIKAEITDAGISGGVNHKRPGFIEVLDRVENGEADVVVLYSLERLSRDMLTMLALERLLEEHEVQLHTVEGQIDTSSPDGFMNFAMKAFLGEMERRQVKYRTKKAMEHKKAQGRVVGAVPYGYQRQGDDLIPDLQEQAVVKAVNSMYQAGSKLVDITAHLNSEGIATREGKPWIATQVRRLINGYERSFKKQQTKLSAATRQFIEAIA
jgi:site-specific DNA recombinase